MDAWTAKKSKGEASGIHIVSREAEARGSSTQQWFRVLGCMAAMQAFHRTRGARQSRQGGRQFWACSRPNLEMGQKQSLLTPPCSTTFMKGAKSLDQQIRRKLDAKSRVSTY